MAQIAAAADLGSERRERNIRNARTAHDAVVKFSKKMHASAAERHYLRQKLRRLRLDLENLGERFWFFAIDA
jgi:hypothetical protein